MKNTALKYGNQACITMMKKFDASDLPPKGGFHYHAGVFLSGMMELYKMCHPSKNGHRKASKNGMNRSLSFVFEIRPHLFHGSLDNEPLPT